MKTPRLFIVGIICGLVGVVLLSHDHASAHNQASSLVKADASGQDVAIQVNSLKSYVKAHMGTSVSFELKGAYQRQQQAAEAQSQPQTSGNVYQQAQTACASLKDPVQQAQCNQNYINTHLQAAQTTPVAMPNEADYKYVLASSAWTPDAAGLLIGLSVLTLLFAAGRLMLRK